MLDATHNYNNIRMPLLTDKYGHGQPVVHALLAREDKEHISMFINNLLAWQPGVASATFITDKDFAEINAVHRVCPDTKVFLCRFHLWKK